MYIIVIRDHFVIFFFFFNDTATTEIYTLSLHDALPISVAIGRSFVGGFDPNGSLAVACSSQRLPAAGFCPSGDRKSTRLNSSHSQISYAVFCLKKKKITHDIVVDSISDLITLTLL